ncbi:unnamed protein product [marine sediment metagenome]|uniref:Ribbon-helix-helix protein CopG domain-containing protein n=1 Tax=marine sediment metagenome TaxID=412755 RepID=X1BXH9_9ZZZZ
MPKQKLTLSIDKEIITQAKKKQINISSFLEIRLVDYLNYLEFFRLDLNRLQVNTSSNNFII